jgi:hypothetical protein
MGDLLAVVFGIVAVIIMVAAYVGLVGAYFVFAAPVIASIVALYVAGDLIAGYFHRMHGVVIRRAPEFELIPPYRPGTPENGPEPAYRQYFFGPALRDLRQVIVLGWQRGRGRVVTLADRYTTMMFTAPRINVVFTWPVGVTLWAGLIAGVVLGVVLGGMLALLHAGVVVGAQLTARACTGMLMAVDALVLHARGVHGMQCPWCYERNSYPAYRCDCNRLHHDIRPGRYGVFRRRCECGDCMPTLILLGSYRMNAICVYCDRQMSDETGRFREAVLPLLGGRAAGKTRLMAAMLIALHEQASEPGPAGGAVELSLANAETQVAYDVLSTVLDSNGYIMATGSELPHAHSVRLRVGRHTRLVHIFDPAGERLVDRDRTDELRYLEATRSFLFVLDPMAVPGFWSSLTEADQSTLDRTLASKVHPQDVFDRTLQQMIAMGSQPRKSRLTVAISKTDLVENTKLFDGRREDEQWARWWLTDRLGLGNLIRSMDHEFREVRFFFTAAVTVTPGRAHESISPLVTCSLGIPSRGTRAA